MREWANTSLGMYIDDGAIFACGCSWSDIKASLQRGYATCLDWLTRAGLKVEPDKTELIYFRKCRKKMDPPSHISLPLPLSSMQYRVTVSTTLHYLGFFFNHQLSWLHHVEIMCNQAQATLKALQLLGNSVYVLDQARWRLAYNAICLPVLIYRCQLWYSGKQITLVKKLQVIQNEVVRLISGTFWTTPQYPLHQLLNILPMNLCLNMLLKKTALRLYKAPRGSQLLVRLGSAWHSLAIDGLPLPASNRASLKTTLHILANRVPVNSPCIDPFLELPPRIQSLKSLCTCVAIDWRWWFRTLTFFQLRGDRWENLLCISYCSMEIALLESEQCIRYKNILVYLDKLTLGLNLAFGIGAGFFWGWVWYSLASDLDLASLHGWSLLFSCPTMAFSPTASQLDKKSLPWLELWYKPFSSGRLVSESCWISMGSASIRWELLRVSMSVFNTDLCEI